MSDLSERLPQQFFATLVKNVNARIAAGHDVINLGQGNPDQPTPANIVAAAQQAVADPKNHKYSLFRGQPDFKQAAADFYQREYGVTLDPETEIAVVAGSKSGLVELPQIWLNPGDHILLPDPGYPDYLSGVAIAQATLDLLPITAEHDWLPDYTQVAPEVAEAAKLIYLNYPNNPTGAVATPEFFEETVDFARQHDIKVVHDFAYGALGTPDKRPVSFLQAPGAKDVGIEFYTLSKTYNMAGWRIGFAAGNKDLIEAINLIQDHMLVSVFPAVQEAGVAALNGDQSSVASLVALYQKRRDAWYQAADQIGWHATPSQGTFYAWMPVPAGYTSGEFSQLLLDQADVAVADGRGFGDYGEGYVRIGLLTSPERLQEAAARIGRLGLFA
ncbi:aminotransferase class I/II-fold pyridoxal phosphate-dependent enzyme [Lacticaseibacillus saniviri]